MSKRSKGASGRPGQRRAVQRTAARPAQRAVETVPVSQATPEDLVQDLPEATAEGATSRPTGSRSRTRGPSTSFEESTAQEYAYVASDVRRIAIVGGSLFAVLIALWLLIEVLGIVKL